MFRILFFIFFISNVISQREIPLRYDTALQYLRQYQQTNFVDHIDEFLSLSVTQEKLLTSRLQEFNAEIAQCEQDFGLILESLERREMWAMKTIDAWAKPLPSGILKGNTYWVGDYDECLKPYYLSANKTFLSQPVQTQYCSLKRKRLKIIYFFVCLGTLNYGTASSQQLFGGASLVLGLCVPTSCNHSDVISLLHRIFEKTNLTADQLVCSTDPANGQENLTIGAIVTIVILSILCSIVLVGTIVDRLPVIKRYMKSNDTSFILINDDEKDTSRFPSESVSPAKTFLAEFSAWRTLCRIFTMKQKVDNESFPFIHGMRVLSLFWVIIGHSLLFGLVYAQNPLEVLSWTHNAAMELIQSAEFSVDTFFVLSGFLTTVLFVRHFDKERCLSARTMFLYYVHRYIRLTPTYLIVIAISINLTPYFGSGPVFPSQNGFEAPQCRNQYWWTSILYIGNLYKSDYLCLPVSWYLQNDMQFHWIAPLCLIPFVLKRKPIAFILTVLLILVSIGSIAGLLLYYPDLQTGILGGATTPVSCFF